MIEIKVNESTNVAEVTMSGSKGELLFEGVLAMNAIAASLHGETGIHYDKFYATAEENQALYDEKAMSTRTEEVTEK